MPTASRALAIKSAIIYGHDKEFEINGNFVLSCAPLGAEMGHPFLWDAATGNIYPMSSVKSMKR